MDVGNRGWVPIQVCTDKVSTSYFNSVQNVHYVKNVELRFQPQYVYNACFGFRAKFQNNMVSEISTFCNHRNVNNICKNFVNTDYEEVSAYNCVLSMDESPISTALDHQNDHIQSNVENSTPKIGPSLLFEASGNFFGVVYHDVSQETFCDSSTFCPSVGSIESVTKQCCNFKKFNFWGIQKWIQSKWSFKSSNGKHVRKSSFKKLIVHHKRVNRWTKVQ